MKSLLQVVYDEYFSVESSMLFLMALECDKTINEFMLKSNSSFVKDVIVSKTLNSLTKNQRQTSLFAVLKADTHNIVREDADQAYLKTAEIIKILNLNEVISKHGSSLNLCGANLKGAQLQFADLRGANLDNCDLQGANLFQADLKEASLIGANLEGCNLVEVNLYGANLTNADLRRANLKQAELRNTNMLHTSLRGAELWSASIWGVDMQETFNEGVDLTRADTRGN